MPAEAGDGDGGQAGGEMRLNERERLNGMYWSEVDDSGNGGRGTTADRRVVALPEMAHWKKRSVRE